MPRGMNDRLKDNFVEVLRQQALEAVLLAGDAGDDPDLREALRDMLARTRSSARALGLGAVERAAGSAVRAVEDGVHAVKAVEDLVEQCRTLDGVSRVLRPVVVVAATPDNEQHLRAQAEGLGIAVQVTSTVEAAMHAARTEAPAALVLPAEAMPASFAEDEQLRDLPLYVYGDEADLSHRLRAARSGAAGYLPAPLDLRDAVPRIRGRLSGDPGSPFRVLLVDDDDARLARVGRQIEDEHVQVTPLADPHQLLAALEDAAPDLVVLAEGLRAMDAIGLVAVLRGHHRYDEVPRVLLVEDGEAEVRALAADVEAVLRTDADQALLHARIRALLERRRHERCLRAFDPATGVLTRGAVLRAADRELAAVRRARHPLTVARIDLDEAMRLRQEIGRPAVDAALRHLARALREGLRETDTIGQMGINGYLALMPGCQAPPARARMESVARRYGELTATDGVLVQTGLVYGVADTNGGAEDALLRADRDLLTQRARGVRGRT